MLSANILLRQKVLKLWKVQWKTETVSLHGKRRALAQQPACLKENNYYFEDKASMLSSVWTVEWKHY